MDINNENTQVNDLEYVKLEDVLNLDNCEPIQNDHEIIEQEPSASSTILRRHHKSLNKYSLA